MGAAPARSEIVREGFGTGRAVLGAVALFILQAAPAEAHAFGQRYSLPMPLWLYLTGAGAAVGLSFVVMALFVREKPRLHGYPRFNLLRFRVGRLLAHPYVLSAIRLLSVGLFLLILAAGFFGTGSSIKNIAPTMVWVIWWVGLAYVCALVGDFWALINPWRILFSWGEALYRRIAKREGMTPGRSYPRWLGYWPSVLLFGIYAWVELVWHGGEEPLNIALLAAAYSVITWGGMAVFGPEEWLRRGEVFSAVFGLLARFAPMEVRVSNPRVCASCVSEDCGPHGGECVNCYACWVRADGADREWNLRPHAVGLLTRHPVQSSLTVLVLLVLSSITFDGFLETPAWAAFLDWIAAARFPRPFLLRLQSAGVDILATLKTAALVVFPVLFLGTYLICCRLMARAAAPEAEAERSRGLAGAFVFSLVPIAIGYHLAHYLSYLLIAGQLVIPLASDPFGFGWDLFGTVNYRLRVEVLNARFVWFTALAAILTGHIVAVYLAHVTAMRIFRGSREALRSQVPMLVLMIGYTVVSLWILSQPLVQRIPGG